MNDEDRSGVYIGDAMKVENRRKKKSNHPQEAVANPTGACGGAEQTYDTNQ